MKTTNKKTCARCGGNVFVELRTHKNKKTAGIRCKKCNKSYFSYPKETLERKYDANYFINFMKTEFIKRRVA